MDPYGWLRSLVPQSNSIPRTLLVVLLLYSFTSQFLPIEPYLVPYLTSVKNFTNYQVIYGFGTSARLVFSSYIFLLVAEEEYQTMTSLTQTVSLLSFVLASELGQFLALKDAAYEIFFIISLTALGVCCTLTFLLPKDHSSSSFPSLTILWHPSEGWNAKLKETWNGRSLKILSLWWAVAFAGISLVQNYGTNLFDAIDPQSKFNGHILAVSEAAGSLGSYYAIYIDKFANRSRQLIYLLGSAFMGILCISMGVYANIWGAYVFYVTICAIYRTFACLVSVQCGRLLQNGQFILLFSINNFVGLLIETLLQAAVELSGLSIFLQFIAFSGLFFVATAIFICFSYIDNGRDTSDMYMISEPEPEYILSDCVPQAG